MKRSNILVSLLVVPLLALCSAASNAASVYFDSFFADVFAGNISVNSDAFRCGLTTNAYTPNKGTHDRRNDITNEVVGTGYTAGGTSCTVSGTLDTTNHRYSINVTGPSWPSSTITARGMFVYKYRGGASSADELIGWIDFGADITSTNSSFNVTVNQPFRITN